MKKIVLSLFLIVSVTVFAANSVAQAAELSDTGRSSLLDVGYSSADNLEQVTILLDKFTSYSTFRLSDPDRIVIDIPDTAAPNTQQKIDTGSKLVKSVRYAQFDNNAARVVLDVSGQPEYKVDKENDRLVVHVGSFENSDTATGGSNQAGSSSTKDAELSDRGGSDDRYKIAVLKDFNIEYSEKGSVDEIKLSIESYKGYNLTNLSNPERIAIDIPGVSIPGDGEEKMTEIDSNLVKSIRYAQLDKDTVRIVVDVAQMPQIRVEEKTGQLILKISNPLFKNITYHDTGDRIYFTLDKARLTDGGDDLVKFYTEEYDSSGLKYTVTFPGNLADLDSGTINVNDSRLDSVEINNDLSAGCTSVTFNAKDKFLYNIFTRTNTNDTAITLLKPASASDRLVVIDAGHGGVDPGAKVGELCEKDLNLDIAVRLNNMLKSKNIKTFMMREDDNFVGLYERAYIANNLNAALFLSVHNNAMDNTSYGGTMTLCYPQSSNSSFGGRTFAQIIQNKLISTLKTTDRKVIDRPNLVVLKATAMPAAIAEVAFLTNAGDRDRLKTSAFREKAAQALCDAVIEALEKIK